MRFEVQRRNGTWEEISNENPIPVWVTNPSGPPPMHVTVEKQEEIRVSNLHDVQTWVAAFADGIATQLTSLEEVIRSREESANWSAETTISLLMGLQSQLRRMHTWSKYLLLSQVIITLSILATAILAIVR